MLFIEHIFPYVSAAIFLGGIAHKLHQWLTVPSPFPTTIFPAPGSPSARLSVFLKEILLFNNLYRHSRLLWLFSWTMHLSLGLIIVGHIAGIYFLGEQFTLLGISKEGSLALSNFLGMAAGTVLVFSLLGLIGRRLSDKEARATSVPSNYFDLVLLTGIALTGIFLRLSITAPELELIREYLAGLILFRPASIPDSPWFFWHFMLLNILMMYLPYSKLRHWLGGWIVRLMLTEPPPEYPTPAGRSPRSSFAAPVNDDRFQRSQSTAATR